VNNPDDEGARCSRAVARRQPIPSARAAQIRSTTAARQRNAASSSVSTPFTQELAMPTSTATLELVADAARPIVERIVWCTVTTVGPDRAPRSRLMHPVWWWDGRHPVALVTARPTALKRRHLAANPVVSCFYWDPAHDTVAIDGDAEWLTPAERPGAWEQIKRVAPPVGFDPAMIWPTGPLTDDCGFMRLTARRIVVTPAGRPGLLWRAPV
jgi:hypothetical protein